MSSVLRQLMRKKPVDSIHTKVTRHTHAANLTNKLCFSSKSPSMTYLVFKPTSSAARAQLLRETKTASCLTRTVRPVCSQMFAAYHNKVAFPPQYLHAYCQVSTNSKLNETEKKVKPTKAAAAKRKRPVKPVADVKVSKTLFYYCKSFAM